MSPKSQITAAIADVLRLNDSFLIVGHVNPDGDCLGSMCALAIGLRQLGKKVTMLCAEGVPDLYRFLPESEKVVQSFPLGDPCDVAITVDCEDINRVGDVLEAVRSCRALVEFDHHPGGKRETPLALVDASSASTGEVLIPVLKAAGIEITSDIATCLLTAIVTDTGSFRFTNVRSSTLRTAADLMDAGASVSKVAHQVYEVRSFASLKVLGLALSTLQTTADGRIAYASITQNQLQQVGASEADAEGIPNCVKSIQGVEVGLFFREGPDGTIRVSLRSREGLDVSQVARLFGGGGHLLASGCTLDEPLDVAEKLVIDAVKKCMGF
jgi:phosphoesterase RecJ-like protein